MPKFTTNTKRWESASKAEKHFWLEWKKNVNLDTAKTELMQRAKKIDKIIHTHSRLKRQKILHIGPAANGEIHFLKGKRYAIDPLALFFIKTFPQLIDKRVAYIKGMAENLSYKDSFFDIILILNVLDHCCDPGQAVTEMRRCLKKNGIIIFQVNIYSRFASILHKFFYYIDPEHPYALTYQFIRNLLKDNKFKVIKEKKCNLLFTTPNKMKYIFLFLIKYLNLIPRNYQAIIKKL